VVDEVRHQQDGGDPVHDPRLWTPPSRRMIHWAREFSWYIRANPVTGEHVSSTVRRRCCTRKRSDIRITSGREVGVAHDCPSFPPRAFSFLRFQRPYSSRPTCSAKRITSAEMKIV